MPFLTELQLDMPDEFPAAVFTEFMARARVLLLNPKGSEWSELAGASNIMGWRFRNATDGLDEFAESWQKHGDAGAGFEEFYRRDRSLFAVFSSGVSCIEATCYGIYAVASHPKTLGVPFGTKDQKRAYPAQLRNAVKAFPPASMLCAALDKMLASSEWETWTAFRNRMAHRSNLPRMITMTVGAPLPDSPPINVAGTSSTKAFGASLEEMRQLIAWLGATQMELLVAATGLIPR